MAKEKKSKAADRPPTIDAAVSTTAADAALEHLQENHPHAEVVPSRESASAAVDRLKEIELELLEKANVIVQDAMSFYELDDAAKEPPPGWIDKYGEDEAWRRFRRVIAGQASGAFAPIGVKVATNVMTSIIKKSKEEDRSPQLNIRVAELQLAINYPTKKIEK